MPKLGAKPDTRPYNTRCMKCKCLVEKMVSRFGFDGKPSHHIYRCLNPYHNCGTVERDGCAPQRVYDDPVTPAHGVVSPDGFFSTEHPGPLEGCERPECADRQDRHRAGLGQDTEWHPGPYVMCNRPECEPPFERGDVATAGDTSWREWLSVPDPGEPGDPWPPLASDEDI